MSNMISEEERVSRDTNIQEMINKWLSDNGFQTLTERMAQNGKREILGQLTADHKLVLQQMIAQKFPDLSERIKAAGASSNGKQVLGFMTKVEMDLVDELLNNFLYERNLAAKVAEGDTIHIGARAA